MTALAELAESMFGDASVTYDLAVTQSVVPNMQVAVAAGNIYAMTNMDSTSYGSLAADTTHQVMKQGQLLTGISLSCPAPGTVGFSINYLIQAAFAEVDVGSVVLPYYNASNPTMAWSGPANAGTPQATTRQDQCVVTVKAGAAAATGTQATPTPDTGNVGLSVVTVAYGAASILNANITQYVGASLVPQGGLASSVAHAIYSKNVAGASNVTLTPQEAAYPILTLTGLLTGNIQVIVPASSRQRIVNNQTSGAFQVIVITAAGTGVVAPQGYTLHTYCDGTNVLSATSALLTQAAADARYAAIIAQKPTGEVFNFAGTAAPAGSLICPTAQTNISRTTYAALFAVIGVTWGVGDGSTTFGMPWFPADYAAIQAAANVGTQSVGAVIAHTHQQSVNANVANAGSVGTQGQLSANNTTGGVTGSTGGAANLAAGVRVLMCVKY